MSPLLALPPGPVPPLPTLPPHTLTQGEEESASFLLTPSLSTTPFTQAQTLAPSSKVGDRQLD